MMFGRYIIDGKTYDPDVYDKYLRNLRQGRRAAAYEGLPEFTGYPPDYHDGITLRAYFDEETLAQVDERVVGPIKKLAKKAHVKIYPNTLWTPHIALVDLKYRSETPGTREDVFERVAADSRVSESLQTLSEEKIVFDTLFAGGVAVTLAAAKIPDAVPSIRDKMTQLAGEYDMGEKNLNNIVHTTVARMGPRNEPRKVVRNVLRRVLRMEPDYNAFGRGLMQIHHGLVREPIVASFGGLDFMPNKQFQEEHERGLFPKKRIS